MPTILVDTVVRSEVVATAAEATPIILMPEGAQDLSYSAKVASSGTGNAIEGTVDSFAAIQAGTAEWFSLVANVTDTAWVLPSPLANGNGAPYTLTAIRANRNDQDITLVLTGKRVAQ